MRRLLIASMAVLFLSSSGDCAVLGDEGTLGNTEFSVINNPTGEDNPRGIIEKDEGNM
jgi:hypothetical protein